MDGARTSPLHVLLLAGSGEARALAPALQRRPGLRVSVAVADAQGWPQRAEMAVRVGRFGSAEALQAVIEAEGYGAVLDATHPFADRISHQAHQAAQALDLPHAQVLRPTWQPGPADRWHTAPDADAAARLLRPGQRVFVTSGQETVQALRAGSQARLWVRQKASTPRQVWPDVTYVPGHGPFSTEDECKTFRDLQIEALVTKNSGGSASRSKLDAARALGLPVILIDRPARPNCLRLNSVEAALAWVATL